MAAFSSIEWYAVLGQVCNGLCNSVLVLYLGAVGKQFISQGAVIALTTLGVVSSRDPFAVTPAFLGGSLCVFLGVWVWKFGLPGRRNNAKQRRD